MRAIYCKCRSIGCVRGCRSSRKIPTSTVTAAVDPSCGALRALTIDLIHDWCQRGTIGRLVLAHDQWHALIVGKSLEREKAAVAGAYCHDLRLHFKHGVAAQLLTGFCSWWSCFAICPRFKRTSAQPLILSICSQKTAKLEGRNAAN